MTNESILYKIGKTIGETLRPILGRKIVKRIKVDLINGDDDSNGIDKPTTNITTAFTTLELYNLAEIELINSTPKLTSVQQITNHIFTRIFVTGESGGFNFDYTDPAQKLLSCISISNSFVRFENCTFKVIANEFSQPDYNIGHVPIYAEFSTIIFDHCTFEVSEATDSLCFLTSNASNIYFFGCTIPDNMLISAQTPSLVYSTTPVNLSKGSIIISTQMLS